MKTKKIKISKKLRRKTLKGASICSPYSNLKKVSKDTCMTPDIIMKVKNAYNRQHPSSQIETNDPIQIFEIIKERNKCKNDACWVSKIKNKEIKKYVKDHIFIPEKPSEWKKNPTEWLSNFDILDVLKQYQEAYPHFKFIGPVPIDFNKKMNHSCISNDLCSFHLSDIDSHNKIHIDDVGIIFNLDKHDEPGSHWVSMFIDKKIKRIFYFDSASTDVPREINELKNRLIHENSEFSFVSNTVEHQRGNTECGMYSLYFIISMLLSHNRENTYNHQFNNTDNKVTDKMVEQYRNVYFQ